jgi:4-amino-4-deoxy-L-arabinose transferase-like glycosyltransferase
MRTFNRPLLAIWPLLTLSAVTLIAHVLVGSRYDYFRDELYYLACSDKLSLGYVDHPPLSIALLRVTRNVLGDSLWAIRLPAWLAGAGTVFVTGLLAREVGGGRFAQVLAALCVAVGPVYLAVAHFYSMNALDILLWPLAAFAFARALSSSHRRWWLVLGAVLGFGLQNKISVLWLGAGMGAALVLTSHRRWLRTRWPWASGILALVIFLPHIVWQIQHGWPTLEFIHNAATKKMSSVSALDFVTNQALVQHPITLPIWISGLVFLWVSSRGDVEVLSTRRALVWVFLTPAMILIASGTSRANYLSPAFPILFAGGGAALESGLRRSPGGMRAAVIAAIVALGTVTAPAGLPVLSAETFVKYSAALKLTPRQEEKSAVGLLPQHYADQFGWRELAHAVRDVYFSLPEADRAKCAIFATNYGRAGAVDFFGRKLGLPRAISGHNNYFLWGPRQYTGEIMIIVGGRYEDHAPDFEEVTQVGISRCRYCMPYEDGVPIFVCRRLRTSLQNAWPSVKEYI